MRKFFGFVLSPLPFALSLVGAILFALCLAAHAQQPTKIPRIGYVSGPAISRIQALTSRHSGKGCGLSDILREKTSWLSIATRRE